MMNKLSTLPLLAFGALMHPLQALAQQSPPSGAPVPQWYGPGPWHMWGGGYGFWWGPFFMMVVFAVVIGLIVFFVARRHGSHCAFGGHGWGHGGRHPSHSALQILSERFAKGEIQQEEYEAKRAAILRRD